MSIKFSHVVTDFVQSSTCIDERKCFISVQKQTQDGVVHRNNESLPFTSQKRLTKKIKQNCLPWVAVNKWKVLEFYKFIDLTTQVGFMYTYVNWTTGMCECEKNEICIYELQLVRTKATFVSSNRD